MVDRKLGQDEFKEMRDYIYIKSGMYFPDSKKYLIDSRVTSRMEELSLDSLDAYLYYLKYDPKKEAELTKLLDEVTINETSFFRNMPQIDALKNIVLPNIIESKKEAGIKNINIWSAACSSGEEPYTIAIILKEVLGYSINTWNINLLATDINTEVLEKAKKGVYTRNSLRNTPDDIKKKYFTENKDNFIISSEIKDRINFQRLNLVDRMKTRLIRSQDIIFCRNVLIYFDLESKKRVVSSLYNSLANNGHLFIGHSESLHGVSSAFKLMHLKGCMVYKKDR